MPYPLPDTGQTTCYDETGVIACPGEGEPFYGQDGTYDGARPQYVDNGDGTVTDLVTGLMWQQDPGDKMTYAEAAAGAGSFTLAGYDDWRLPTIKELYSLIDFGGTDPSACRTDDGCGAVPFIDDEAFAFSYGDPSTERLIDSQWATATIYDGTTMGGNTTMFGVNFADGRIKGYPIEELHGEAKGFFVIYVRGGDGYGENDFADNGDGTVSDLATGLMWQQGDSGAGMEWAEALEYCEALDTAGYDDWRLPDAKELQSIVDYGRGPQSTGTAAIDPVFEATPITDEGGGTDWGFYWTGTTHASTSSGASAVYVAFGEALGWMQVGGDTVLQDVHGAGAQRSDPKTGDASEYPFGHGPQGDVIRIDNMVRCVRGGDAAATSGTTADVAQASGEAGPAAAGTGAPAGGPLAGAAAALGVAEDALVAALGDPGRGTPDFEDAALRLGVTVEELMAVLPPPPAP
ncbi:MAG: DUF1566 domain-containing protein [Actinobacteria bacterium]|nr:DUF1566 domain-containing protein [Actinomycetota bacterium]